MSITRFRCDRCHRVIAAPGSEIGTQGTTVMTKGLCDPCHRELGPDEPRIARSLALTDRLAPLETLARRQEKGEVSREMYRSEAHRLLIPLRADVHRYEGVMLARVDLEEPAWIEVKHSAASLEAWFKALEEAVPRYGVC